jgi:hypothetical protein
VNGDCGRRNWQNPGCLPLIVAALVAVSLVEDFFDAALAGR